MGASMRASWAASESLNRQTSNVVDNHKVRRAQKALQTSNAALRSGYLFPGIRRGVDAPWSPGLPWPGHSRAHRRGDGRWGGVLRRIRNPRSGFSAEVMLPQEVINTHVAIVAPAGSGKTHGPGRALDP